MTPVTMPEHYIEDPNLSLAWGQALKQASQPGRREMAPLIVSITGFDDHNRFIEAESVRASLDKTLGNRSVESVETVANTIFPQALWNPRHDRQQLFDRYRKIEPRLRKASRKNARGLYFERMTMGGPRGQENQLEFAINAYTARRGVRRGALQVAIFDPHRDHSNAARLGFPCLQHVTFAPTKDCLNVNAFYATQYLVTRAYGNYVGLCRLGRFMAHELQLPLGRVTCFAGIAIVDDTKGGIAPLLRTIEEALAESRQAA